MKIIIITLISIILTVALSGCFFLGTEGPCFDIQPDDNLNFSFKLLNKKRENILHLYNEDTISIYKENHPDPQATYRLSSTYISFKLNEKPYVGEHSCIYHVYLNYNDIDTLKLTYSIVEDNEDICYNYKYLNLKCFYNGIECFINPRFNPNTYEFFK